MGRTRIFKYPGLTITAGRKRPRVRVRVKGAEERRITIQALPGDPDFERQYECARRGVSPETDGLILSLKMQKQIMQRRLSQMINRHKERGMESNLDRDFLHGMLESQNWRCAVSGVEFSLDKAAYSSRLLLAPSIDRIDNSKGYLRTNVRLVTVAVNTARSDMIDEEFLKMCRAVTRNFSPRIFSRGPQ